ncbi:helix-turn-helix transcriptional regulator [Sodalis ligni]|uniref:helix-turn-helix transcriptional regulator n=1 Tax=Sodalis ligni TaxID=2697027 RepID=UPI001BDEB59B|nr:helix-turn-helix transcriptional regulator [Sodalis ligni]QWA12351.1 helix-turn-helix transcriptional regulator [Sodalis ligni]
MKLLIINAQSLGSTIRDVRIQKGLTQAELGLKVQMHQKDISIFENNAGNIKLSRMISICAMLGLKIIIEDDAGTKAGEDMW